MPRYTYTCAVCKRSDDAYRTVADRDLAIQCGDKQCDGIAYRDVGAEMNGSSGGSDGLMKENERWSWSMGIHVEQIPEMVKKFPGSEYHPLTGQLKIKNRNHKLNEMKRRGFEEYV